MADLIVYQNDGTEVTTDSFTLHLSDGKFEKTKTVSVIIGLANDETPRVTVNRGLRVQAGRYRQQTLLHYIFLMASLRRRRRSV